ncbi:aspartate dehydrogenase [Methanobrevibacter sp. OttesenSCG-928-K11]|nr:aspartate dehydrogenase [Methanobrevibacter sp. OttesenSCG-928-K11]MDL2270856.1 aspartate dehydrogenase [Methanobrevibacter sp. OttesenSCG-928-I08]
MQVGILGCGAIANIIVNHIMDDDSDIEINYFFDNDIERAENLANIAGGIAVLDFEKMVDKVDLVLEAASPESVETFALKVLEKGKDIIIMSIGALMDRKLRENLINIAQKNNAKIHAPSGAVVGLDGIKAISDSSITKATLITRKPPKSLGKDTDKEEILFEGKASEAVKKFPVNINVAAAVSLACKRDIHVKILVDPKVNRNIHEIIIKGNFGEFNTKVMNFPCSANPKTSMLAALSAIKLLKSFNETFSIGT